GRRAGSPWRRRSAIRPHIGRHGCPASSAGSGSRRWPAVRRGRWWCVKFAGAWVTEARVQNARLNERSSCPALCRASTSSFTCFQDRTWMAGTSPAMTAFSYVVPNPSNQILLGDDFAEPGVVCDELLDEFMHAVLKNIVHMTVLQAVADAAGV